MAASNAEALKDPAALLALCQKSLPSWSTASLSDFSFKELKGGYSSPAICMATCSTPGADPNRVVVKAEPNSEDHPLLELYDKCANIHGEAHQEQVGRQVGAAGLGPQVLPSPAPGVILIEAVHDGSFEDDFGDLGLSASQVESLGKLVAGLHLLDTKAVDVAATNARSLVEENLQECSVTEEDVEEIWQQRGGYGMLLLWWWGRAFPRWCSRQDPIHKVESDYKARVTDLIMAAFRLSPLSRNLGKMGFCHCDLWSNNMLKKGEAIIAIDFETASTGPALLDLGSSLFAFRKQKLVYMERAKRELLANTFIKEAEVEADDMEKMLFDLEIGFLHRTIWVMLCCHFDLKMPKRNARLVSIAELMVKALQQGQEDEEVRRQIVKEGVFYHTYKDFPLKETEELWSTE